MCKELIGREPSEGSGSLSVLGEGGRKPGAVVGTMAIPQRV